MTKRKLTPITLLHYIKLICRSLLLLAALGGYIFFRVKNSKGIFEGNEGYAFAVLGIIWLLYVTEMAIRFFPSRFESMGCGKQFKRNYEPTGEEKPRLQSPKRTLAVILAWLGLNGVIAALYYLGVIDRGILVLITLTYGVCDMICILFFCPFQTWFMKNRCCGVCRIYNWDFAMMFTPLVLIPHAYTWSLLGLSLILLLRWEITYRLHPERFSETTNACLSCGRCEEKLCHHKKQLLRFWEKNKEKLKNYLPTGKGQRK